MVIGRPMILQEEKKDCLLIEECITIDELYKSDKALILIDDYRLFGTNIAEDWTDITLENIISCFKKHLCFFHISDDILAILIFKHDHIF